MTAPAKKAAAKKLPHGKAKASKIIVRATYEAFGRDDWRIIRPNQLLANKVMPNEDGEVDLNALNRFFASHLHPEDRKPFFDAAMADDTLDIERLMEMQEQMTELAFTDVG